VLADFEDAGSAEVWRGLPCRRTDRQASSGSHALEFVVPAWKEGLEPRPGLRLALDPRHRRADFSGYGSIVVDAWVEGDQPGSLGLSLRDQDGNSSWTTHITVEPHAWNRAELPIRDAAADCDVSRVKEVVLYALRPTNSFTLLVDDLRLEPAPPRPTVCFRLRHPNYRGWILPDYREVEVEAVVAPNGRSYRSRDLTLRLQLNADGISRQADRPCQGETNLVRISARDFPAAEVRLQASLCSGGWERGRQSWPLRLLSSRETRELKSYVDAHNRLIVEGKPFLPLGWYGAVDETHLAEIARGPFNCLLAYGTDGVPRERMRRFLDAVQSADLKLVYCLNDLYPTATYLEAQGWEGIKGNAAIATAVVRAYRDHPSILAWYLNDELPHRLAPELEDYYHQVRTEDPSHPCFIVLCNRSELPYFPQTTDILGVDTYPVPKDPVARVGSFVASAYRANCGTQPVWLVPQAFAWYQYNSKNPDRGHTPTEEELRSGRAPTREEERCMTYLGLIQGAKGLLYYCYYDLRVLPQYREMWAWMKAIAAEVKTLAPALLSIEPASPWRLLPEHTAVQARLLRHQGDLYLLAVNPERTPSAARFELPRQAGSEVEVMFEDRSLSANRGRFDDQFAPLAVHVYRLKIRP
jgi:hypothetical protein